MYTNEIEQLVNEALRIFPNDKPEHFTNFSHCEECKEHDETLLSHTRESISYNEIGNSVWDPIAFVNESGFKYYFPALVRLALYGKDDEYYIEQFLFHITNIENCLTFNETQSKFVVNLLEFIKNYKINEIESNMDLEELNKAIQFWKEKIEAWGSHS